jgi:hypothetical protein
MLCSIIAVCALPLHAQTLLDSLHPQPRQAYVRMEYSAIFMPSPAHRILLDPAQPAWDAARALNAGLRGKGLDTMAVAVWTDADSLTPGIALGVHADFINNFLQKVPDQFLQITATYPGPEGYVVDVMPMRALISGSDEAGMCYGVDTFLKLLWPKVPWWGLQACRIVDAPEFPVRWFYYPTNVLVAGNTPKAKALWDRALGVRLNGVHLIDSKFSRPTTLPQRYNDSLLSLVRYATDRRLRVIPGVMPFGYSNDMLYHDPNMASGLPVRDQRFVVAGDTARLAPRCAVALSNGGFEQHTGDSFPGYRFIDQPGQLSFTDDQIRHSGTTSIRFENYAQYGQPYGHGRISYWTRVTPFTLYHVSGWVRTEALQPASSVNVSVLSNAGYGLAYNEISVPSTTDWRRIDFTFNSLEADTVGVYWGTWGAKSGRIWWDDLVLEEAPFVNLLRRPGAPLHFSTTSGATVIEGVDVDSLRDPRTGNVAYAGDYDVWHTPPALRIRPGGALRAGDTLTASYYHAILIYSGQVTATMSDLRLYDILRREFRALDSVIAAPSYFLQHDEIRTMNWDAGDMMRGLSPAGILADNVQRCADIIRDRRPQADLWVWSDMFDEFHNAVQGPYYFVHGDLRGSADLIPKDIGIVNWNGRENVVQNSLAFFAQSGFRQISAPYYDQDENQIRVWKEWTRDTPNFLGMMYTTWAGDYSRLEAFGDYGWNHAPYVECEPPTYLRPGMTMDFPVRLTGDRWDAGWQLENAQLLYRTEPGYRFTAVPIALTPGVEQMVSIDITPGTRWLQWYVTATDNRGWTTRQPFGDSVYFELGAIATSVDAGAYRTDAVVPGSLAIHGLAPNPASPESRIRISWSAPAGETVHFVLYDMLGRPVLSAAAEQTTGRLQTLTLPSAGLAPGMYTLALHSNTQQRATKFLIR